MRELAAHATLADLESPGHGGADRRQRHEVADRHVERTAAHLQRAVRPFARSAGQLDIDELDAVSLGMRSQARHPRHHDPVEGRQDAHLLDCHAEVAQVVGQLGGVALDGRELAQPAQQHLHRG